MLCIDLCNLIFNYYILRHFMVFYMFILLHHLLSLLFFFFWGMVILYSPGWPNVFYIVWPQLPKCWDYKHELPYLSHLNNFSWLYKFLLYINIQKSAIPITGHLGCFYMVAILAHSFNTWRLALQTNVFSCHLFPIVIVVGSKDTS